MRQDNESITPTLAEVIQTVIDANLIDVHTCLPAKIVSYDPKTQYASVQIQLKKAYESGAVIAWPVISNVPVIWPKAQNNAAYLHMPLQQDDPVTLIFCERSLDNWKITNDMVDPMDRRTFNITDAFAVPGGSSKISAFELDDPETFEQAFGEAIFQLAKDGTIYLKAQTVNIGNNPSHGVALGDRVESRLSALESAVQGIASNLATHVHAVTSAPGTTGPEIPTQSPFTPNAQPVESQTVKVST